MAPKLKAVAASKAIVKAKAKIIPMDSQTTALSRPLEDWEIKMREKAQAKAANLATGMPRIEHKSATLYIDGKKVEGNKLTVAIVDYVFTKSYFKEAYTQGKGGTPDCYASKEDSDKGMIPPADVRDRQNPQCDGCPHNAFGTADVGRGKRCSDVIKVGCIVEVTDEESIQKAEVRSLSVPPGSIKLFKQHIKKVEDIAPTISHVLTEITAEPNDNGAAYSILFKPTAFLAPEMVQAINAKQERVVADLMQPWPDIAAPDEDEPKKKPKKKIKGQD
jgi:hypothetical protein